ncbi:hypothetical protein SAMN05880501_10313 [Ureibacillus xyleni]|uniref:DUF541 domain-containing protein n=1 Tax=Ureibacillus xyleni TaxID=614648 RepID=A0A285S518_9BACL|nr:SIMPL domain-containing protein [Ureibacillus xyleni]SOC02321.1 hypothetical protein SAMN05880501_10313 [Ureibacillus xyleni]
MDYSNAHHGSHRFRTMTVTGNGKLETKPDYAELQIEVRTESKDVTEAQRQNAVKMNGVIQSLLALNIDRSDIQTSFYNVFPVYDFVEGKQIFRGYEVTNAITVKIRNIAEVGLVIDTAIKNGANAISRLTFKLENEENYYRGALQLALQNANEKAQALAVSLRLSHLPVPIEIVEESKGGPILYKTVALSAETVSTPIEQGTITIEATIRVKYQY